MRGIVVRDSGVALEDGCEELLADDGVLVEVVYSDLNYKDALAVTGRPGVVRQKPLIAGIDLVGRVVESADERWTPGQWLVLNGAGLSETRHGGYAELARADADLAVPVPDGLTPERAAALGTAGYTAALAVLRLVRDGVSPDSGPVLVTGATGGVGSVAVMLLAAAGFDVAALTGREDRFGDYLRDLGASSIVGRQALGEPGRPLQKALYAGVVDSVGGQVLANAIAQTQPHGVVTACGLAASPDLPATVMPFILRGVTLAGIDSVWAGVEDRADAWRVLARGVDLDQLDQMTDRVGLDGVIAAGEELLAGKRHGRTLVEI
ncbi:MULTISPECIES: MDR family oxidoreductase [Tessaracoccus]|uniref:MDR family oxidoreductase n=1 Tax=Tessaracoccus TaxID=72763 RepID=UPI00099D29CE|nr:MULTISPECIES: MDR family oxidoreductase [Tessaracoccus]AQX16633.1 oxidoreductase [Tessaracoccus sp. T2.5-30]VEP41338.1 Acrylyl-CoA reductase AcuI [Tessaracoccus lapidicaptus]